MTETIAAAPEQGAQVKPIHHWIGGKTVEGASGRSGPVWNPATGEQTGSVDFATVEEVDAAVQAAKEAFTSWRSVSLSRRAELFFRIRELVHEHREDVARILTAEHGKVLSDALGEVARGLEVIEYACGIPTLLKGEYSEQASTGIDVYSIRQPLGVVGGITPFNFPAMVPMWMWAPAIACGNTFVLKPSEKDPSASVYVAELLKEAGLPDGVFNVVHGDKVAVDALLEHPDVAAISFVGSTPIARYVYETGTSNGKRMQALGGAKNHMIVLPDADIDMAADAAVSAAYGSAGERCMAVSVVVAVGDAADPLIDAIKQRLPNVKVGPGLEPGSEMGPLITREHRDKVAGYLDTAAEQGATVVADGRELDVDGDGFFLGVSLIDGVTPEMDCYRDEIFGPVLSVVRASTYQEGLELINRNPYGNGTAIFTNDGGAARRFQHEVEVGMVGINVPIPVPVAYYSFGGWKASLFGDTHAYGQDGVHFFTRGKVVTQRWLDPSHGGLNLGFPTNS
ncbi:MAG TPA: CoA-acylating methylmalonate-semialdehyde dehydrogenase [Gaiellaceae bacterium]|nr:CoA-acylating methylmalonate-semialdehyde dehydrogenase [Gaiellaceae bacterium]